MSLVLALQRFAVQRLTSSVRKRKFVDLRKLQRKSSSYFSAQELMMIPLSATGLKDKGWFAFITSLDAKKKRLLKSKSKSETTQTSVRIRSSL